MSELVGASLDGAAAVGLGDHVCEFHKGAGAAVGDVVGVDPEGLSGGCRDLDGGELHQVRDLGVESGASHFDLLGEGGAALSGAPGVLLDVRIHGDVHVGQGLGIPAVHDVVEGCVYLDGLGLHLDVRQGDLVAVDAGRVGDEGLPVSHGGAGEGGGGASGHADLAGILVGREPEVQRGLEVLLAVSGDGRLELVVVVSSRAGSRLLAVASEVDVSLDGEPVEVFQDGGGVIILRGVLVVERDELQYAEDVLPVGGEVFPEIGDPDRLGVPVPFGLDVQNGDGALDGGPGCIDVGAVLEAFDVHGHDVSDAVDGRGTDALHGAGGDVQGSGDFGVRIRERIHDRPRSGEGVGHDHLDDVLLRGRDGELEVLELGALIHCGDVRSGILGHEAVGASGDYGLRQGRGDAQVELLAFEVPLAGADARPEGDVPVGPAGDQRSRHV